ncbi:MAG: hypothetical protein J6Z35_04345 [Lachnospiraceae bacterium]|nr:hypothetical protein [Lachnospiraceae bacterium]
MKEKNEKLLLNFRKMPDVRFFVDGECVSSGQAAEVAEQSAYMADYIIGKEGRIEEIRFDRINDL